MMSEGSITSDQTAALAVATSNSPARRKLAGRTQLGPYRLMGSLGKGGHAQVFMAEHRHLGQLRALKILFPERGTSRDIVGRLMTEARAMARLRHPAIVEVFECDVLPDGTAFIAMEYLRGETLRRWLERVGKLRRHPQLAGAIVAAIAEGLLFAHGQGVIHRDLKPENVLLIPSTKDRDAFSLKILDFGIAKLLREQPLTRTRIGCVVGTPVYMAPEQWRPGHPVDHRADIYALGCLLFELLAGRPPFNATDELSLMRAHLEDRPPSLSALEPGLPPAWDGLIARLLAKSPDDRPQNVKQVLGMLEPLLGQRRSAFSGLLHMPAGWSVVPRETSGMEPVAPRVTRESSMAMQVVRSSLTGAWRGLGDKRRWPLLFVLVGALAACVLLGGVLLVNKHRAARAVTDRPAHVDVGGATTPQLPNSPAADTFKIKVTSQPAGAEVWVEGEVSPRGRTPMDLSFVSMGPKALRLIAPGFRPKELSVWAGRDTAGSAVLEPEGSAGSGARAHPRSPAAKRPSGFNYQKVDD
jgi:tRNA A-37 threonylcarbamoyl transferase component Bud32